MMKLTFFQKAGEIVLLSLVTLTPLVVLFYVTTEVKLTVLSESFVWQNGSAVGSELGQLLDWPSRLGISLTGRLFAKLFCETPAQNNKQE